MALTTVRPQGMGFNTGRRNLIINGAMQVAQRSTSETAQHTTGYITCDRFQLFFANEDELRLTVTQDTDSPSGFSTSFKIQTTTAESAVAADENVLLMQRIEAQDLQQLGYGTSAAKKTTVSFYVKSSVAATYGFNAYHSDGNKVFGQSYTINSANTWERKTITIDANTSDAINNDNGIGLQLSWQLVAGTNFTSGSNSSWETNAEAKQAVGHTANAVGTTTNATWQITGVQLEVGENASDFEHRSFGEELELCKRYYQQIGSGYGKASSTSAFDCSVTFNPPMRANPTVSDNGTVIQITNITSADHNQSSVGCADTDTGVTDGTYGGGRVRFSNFSGLTGGTTYAIDHNGSQGGAAAFDAEL